MKELTLKYGCNPNQKPSRIFMEEGELPVEVLGGRPGYINFLDALNAWQLVRELKKATGLAAAASFKHVSPAGAAVGIPMSDTLKKICFVHFIFLKQQFCQGFCVKFLVLDVFPEEGGAFVQGNHATEVNVFNAGGDDDFFAAHVAQFKSGFDFHDESVYFGVKEVKGD